MAKDIRRGLYGLNEEELAEADRQRISPWDYAERYKGVGGAIKPLTEGEKKLAWQALLMEQLMEQVKDLKIWMDGDGQLLLGWFRKEFGSTGRETIIIRALLQLQSQTIVAIPMQKHYTDALEGVAWCRPWMGQQVWERIKGWRRIVPPGVF